MFFAVGASVPHEAPAGFCFDKTIFSFILEVSIPYGIEQIFLYGGNIVVTAIAVPLGTSAIGANSIANSLFGLVTSTAAAAGNLAVTVTGRCTGAGERAHARRYGVILVFFALFLLIASALSLVSMWAVRVAAGYALAFPLGLGLDGLWIAMWLEWAVRTVPLWARFRRGKWLEKGADA